MPANPAVDGTDPSWSELALPQPGEKEVGGIRGVVWLGRSGHTDGREESMGGVGGAGSEGRGPGARRGSFNCDRGCVSSGQIKNREKRKQCVKYLILHNKSRFETVNS